MASGNTLATLFPAGSESAPAPAATLDTRNLHPTLDFDASTDEEAVWTIILPAHYAGGGLTVDITWAATSATSGSVRWQADIERMNTDMDADSFTGTFQSAGGTANGTSGITTTTAITFTSGGQMDSLAAGETGRIKIRRDADGTSGTDDATGDAELVSVHIKET